MAIGQESFWIIVDLASREAITYPDDRRQSMRWKTEAAALAYANQYHPDKIDVWITVQVFA